MASPAAIRKVAVVGLGRMGGALADTLLAGNFDVTVWNRTPDKAERLVRAGARLSTSLKDAVRGSDAIVTCLSGYDALKTSLVTDEVAREIGGKHLIDLTGMRTEEIGDFAAWSSANGAAFLKGIILAYPDDVRSGACGVLYGGDKAVFAAVRPVLEAMGGNPLHIGEGAEDGANMARAYYCFLEPALVAFLHGSAVCHGMGLSVETYMRGLVLPALGGPAVTGMFERLAKASLARRYDEDVQSTLDGWRNGLDHMIPSLRSAGLEVGLMPATKALMDLAAAHGFGRLDLASVFEALVRRHADPGLKE